MHELTQKIEALLFLAGEAISLQELARLLNLGVPQIEAHVRELRDAYQDHGLSILHTESRVQLVTSSAVADFVREFLQDETQELSAAAAETLAIIAYRGPISRFDISAIRGVDSRRILQQLLMRDLVRKKVMNESRAVHYVVSEEFLQHVGVADVSQLPEFTTLSFDERVRRILAQGPSV